MLTDMKTVWAERASLLSSIGESVCSHGRACVPSVLSSNQLSRRWRDLNGSVASVSLATHEDDYREQIIALLSDAHTLGNMSDLSFEPVESTFSVSSGYIGSNRVRLTDNVCLGKDFAVEIRGDAFKWRWETFLIGPRFSAEVLSKHLIIPLITTAHLAFTSTDPLSELSESDLEKVLSKRLPVLHA